jgi:hypothetical protein
MGVLTSQMKFDNKEAFPNFSFGKTALVTIAFPARGVNYPAMGELQGGGVDFTV